INLVKATMDGLVRLRRPEEVAELRGLTITQVLGMDGQNGAQATETISAESEDKPAEAAAEPVAGDEAAEEKAAEGAEAEKQESGS
ncbi:MAG: hypothetical protein ACTHNY_05520, partial [Solirubrobacterales bacterium]